MKGLIGLSIYKTMACNNMLTHLIVVTNKIDDRAVEKVTTRWSAIDTYRMVPLRLQKRRYR